MDRATRPTTTALAVLGLAAGLVTVVVLGLAVAREVQRSDDDRRQWWQLGLMTGDRVVAVAAPLLLAIAAGLAVAVGAAW